MATPLLQSLPASGAIIATGITSPFVIPLKLAFLCSFVITSPYLFWQIWRFVAPALYPNEKKTILPAVIASITLFFIGIIFGYKVIAPLAIKFFIKVAPSQVTIMTDISSYLDFILGVSIAAGVAFQTPLILVALAKAKIINKEFLRDHRRHAVIIVLTLGMLMTPPDVISQLLLAIPMYLLFELSIILI